LQPNDSGVEVTFDGKLVTFWQHNSIDIEGSSGCCNPAHITVLSTGNVITSEKGIPRVKEYNPNGKFVGVVAGAEAFDENITIDIAVDSKDRILALDPVKKKVWIYLK